MRQIAKHLSQHRRIGPTSGIVREIERRDPGLSGDSIDHRRELHAIVIFRDVRQQRGDMLPRQFGKQLMFGRVAGCPFSDVDAIAFQFLDIFTAEMLRRIAVTKYGRAVSEGREPFRIGLDFGSAVAVEVGDGEAPHGALFPSKRNMS